MPDSNAASDESVMQSVIDSLPDVIFYKDPDGVYRGGNKAWGELLGQPVGTLLGKTDFELFPEELATEFREKDLAMMRSRQSQRNEEWLVYPDGRRALVDTLKAPVFDRDGVLIGLVGSCRDITGGAE